LTQRISATCVLVMAYERDMQVVRSTRAREVLGKMTREDESTHAKFFCNQAQN